MTYQIVRDPARPQWPGVLIVADHVFIELRAGEPVNFADSLTLAKRIVAALEAHAVPDAALEALWQAGYNPRALTPESPYAPEDFRLAFRRVLLGAA